MKEAGQQVRKSIGVQQQAGPMSKKSPVKKPEISAPVRRFLCEICEWTWLTLRNS